ncbi:MAG TPA: hypothetical protein VKA08_11970 [Balneolales bacterium]|jgi:hypothetical protein|nr:hypothetical protein [Balneolales bacterium]
MAKKQKFGDQALEQKMARRKMAKVIISKKTDKGTYSYHESTLDVDNVQEFIKNHK